MQKRGLIFKFFILVVVAFLSNRSARLQPALPNKYGLQVVVSPSALLPAIQVDSPSAVVLLSRFLQPLHTDFVYATPANFTHQVLYKEPVAYLRKEAAEALQKVQDTLQKLGLDIKIWDAYRPYKVTEMMWQIVPDDRYAANPANGSGHNRGVAVDLTLTDATGRELQMPTTFDNFTDSAHHGFAQLPEAAIRNRNILKAVMEQYGFVALPTEWWHYSLPNPRRFALLDIDFEEMQKVVQKVKPAER